MKWLDRAINYHKAIRRILVATLIVLLAITVLRATEPQVLTGATAAGGVIVTAIIGVLTLPIKWYFESRKRDDSNSG